MYVTFSSAAALWSTADLSSHTSVSTSPLMALIQTRDGSPDEEMFRNVPIERGGGADSAMMMYCVSTHTECMHILSHVTLCYIICVRVQINVHVAYTVVTGPEGVYCCIVLSIENRIYY